MQQPESGSLVFLESAAFSVVHSRLLRYDAMVACRWKVH
jgi:hypothetical protein